MPNTKVPAISPTVICANGNFEKLEQLIKELIILNKSTRLFVPLRPLAIRNAFEEKISKNQQIARIQKIIQIAREHGLKIIPAYDSKHALRGQKELNEKPKGSNRTNFEIEYSKRVGLYGEGNSGNQAIRELFEQQMYFNKLAAIDGGLRQIYASNPDEKTIILTKPYFAAYVMEFLKIPTSKYFGVSPYGTIPKMPPEIVQAKRHIQNLKKRTKQTQIKLHPKPKIKTPIPQQKTHRFNKKHGRR
jgi:hypothetical protein